MTETTTPNLTDWDLLAMAQAVRRAGVLFAGLDTAVFDAMADSPATSDEVAARLGLHPRGARVLLNALTAIGMLRRDVELYRLAPGAGTLLVRSSPGYFGHALRQALSRYEWDALGRLGEAARQGGTVLDEHAETPEYPFWSDLARHPTWHTQRVATMLAEVIEPWARPLAPLDVLDVACGHGLYGFTVAQRYPHTRVHSVDWASVLSETAEHAQRLGIRDRVSLVPGDMFEVELGGPHDLTLITNVLHHFSADRVAEILHRLAKATRPGGRLGIVAIIDDGTDPAADPVPHLFSALMLAWTHEGESHSLATYAELLARTGFGPPQLHTVPGVPLRVLLAERR